MLQLLKKHNRDIKLTKEELDIISGYKNPNKEELEAMRKKYSNDKDILEALKT